VLDDLAIAEQTAWHAPAVEKRARPAKGRASSRLTRPSAISGTLESEAFERLIATVPQTLDGAVRRAPFMCAKWFEQGDTIEEEDLRHA